MSLGHGGWRRVDAQGPLLLIEAPLHLIGIAVDLALHLVARIAQLAHGTAHGACHIRYALASKEEQHEDQDEDQLAAADVENEEDRHSGDQGRTGWQAGRSLEREEAAIRPPLRVLDRSDQAVATEETLALSSFWFFRSSTAAA